MEVAITLSCVLIVCLIVLVVMIQKVRPDLYAEAQRANHRGDDHNP